MPKRGGSSFQRQLRPDQEEALKQLMVDWDRHAILSIDVYEAKREEILAQPEPPAPEYYVPPPPFPTEERLQLARSSEKFNTACTLLHEHGVFDDSRPRWIEGVATAPVLSSHGHFILASGVEYLLPLPLVDSHDAKRPVGWVTEVKVHRTRIEFVARIANDGLPDAEEAWRKLINGQRGVSIASGTHGREVKRLESSKGPHLETWVTKWFWEELSICERGANPEALIMVVKEGSTIWRDYRPETKIVRLSAA